MATLGPIVVLELWLDKYAFEINLISEGPKQLHEEVLLAVSEVGRAL